MTLLGYVLLGIPVGIFLYAYAAYPLLLTLAGVFRRGWELPEAPDRWPLVSVSLPAHNEAAAIGGALDAFLAADYPPDRLQIVVVSDASTDGTDEVVASFGDGRVELVRLARRGGKTAAENAALPHLRGEIVVNIDASIRILPHSLKPLVRAFGDPSVGVASGRDVSSGPGSSEPVMAEEGYVGYEMWVRSRETRIGGIVGASGCFYGVRAHLHRTFLAEALSRDFASALVAREQGYRSVSVDDAVCAVPRAASLRAEFRRKLRTMARGLDTLAHNRHLLNPVRHGLFAWKLLSHKLCRWLVPLTLPLGAAGLVLLSVTEGWARALLVAALAGLLLGTVGFLWPEDRQAPGVLRVVAYVLGASVAGMLAWLHVLRGKRSPVWEPTRRTPSTG